eukprot:TRINITY_DN4873_c0_g1_i2.p1 TRINITY_DN4873_c0_g1~~TRINITY_DN4873_c0_g1_i2.p1  ORF type:complete len:262 (+),score=21.64 TRINITY_DN4873_c0_g1_i2:174-959(+)
MNSFKKEDTVPLVLNASFASVINPSQILDVPKSLAEDATPKVKKDQNSFLKIFGIFSRPFEYVGQKFRPGSLKGSIFTLISATLGAGILALPLATFRSGFILSMVQIFGCAILGYVTTYLLVCSAEKIQKFNYFELAYFSFGGPFRLMVKIVFFLCSWSYGVSYFILINGYIATSLRTLIPNVDFPDYLIDVNGYFWQVVIAVAVALPLSLKRRITSLIIWCLIGFGCIIFIMITITAKAFDTKVCDIGINLRDHLNDLRV